MSGGTIPHPARVYHVYIVETPKGFTETFDRRTIETLEALGLIKHEKDFVSDRATTHHYRECPTTPAERDRT